MKEVQAQTGATDEEIAKLRKTAEAVYVTGLGESFEDVAQTMSVVERTTGAADEQLEQMTADALVLSEVFDTDVSESVRAVDQAMIAFGEEGTHVFDLMTRTMQETGDPMDDLADTINEYSTNFAEAGFSADQMFNVLTSGLEAGAWNFDKVGDVVREFFIRLEDGSDTTAEALDGLGLPVQEFLGDLADGTITGADAMSTIIQELQKIEDPIKRNQLGVALFGTMWEDMGDSVILALDPALDKLGEVEGATQQAGETVHSGLGAAWEELKRTLKVSVAGGFAPVLQMIVEKVTPAFQYFADWLAGDGRVVLERFGKLITDNLGPALEQLGPFIEKKVIPALEKFADCRPWTS
jgi:TP901 family phage tail tape measure protein